MERRTPDVTIPQAAEILGVSAFTVGRMVRARRLPHYRIGRRILFDIEELAAWIMAQRVPASTLPVRRKTPA